VNAELLSGHRWRGTLALLAAAIAGTAAGTAALAASGDDWKGAIIVAVAGAAGIAVVVNKALLESRRRIRKIRVALRAIGRGEMDYRLPVEEMGDFASEAAALNTLAEAVSESVQRMSGLTHNLQHLPEEIAQAMAEIDQGAENQEAAVEETASLLANINTSIGGINLGARRISRRAWRARRPRCTR
jgi:methyl-accepting chemotaxis protein